MALGATLVFFASACGSTVQWSGAIQGDGVGEALTEGELSLVDPGKDTQARAQDATAESDIHAAEQGKLVDSPGANKPDQAITSSQTVRARGSGPHEARRGVTANEIFIGYATFKGGDEGTRSLGFDTNYGDWEGQARAIVKDINARGGVGGRKLVLVFHDVPTSDSINRRDAAAQAMCARWTEDQPVFAAINVTHTVSQNTLAACMAKRQTRLIQVNTSQPPRSFYTRHLPYIYAPAEASMERILPRWIQRAAVNGYFDGGWDASPSAPGPEPTKVGIISIRTSWGADFTRIIRKELIRQGRDLAATAEYSGDSSRLANEMSQAAIRFQNSGVTHIITQGAVPLFFSTAAESQHYRPRYAIYSGNSPKSIESRSDQMKGALGVGYVPTSDVQSARDPGDIGDARRKCREIMEKAGQNTSSRDAFDLMVRACDGFSFLKTAIESGGLSAGEFEQGVRQTNSLQAASTFRISFANGRSDGVDAIRDLGFSENCKCFMYLNKKDHGI